MQKDWRRKIRRELFDNPLWDKNKTVLTNSSCKCLPWVRSLPGTHMSEQLSSQHISRSMKNVSHWPQKLSEWNTSQMFQRWCKYTRKDDGSNIYMFLSLSTQRWHRQWDRGQCVGLWLQLFLHQASMPATWKIWRLVYKYDHNYLGSEILNYLQYRQYITKYNTKSDERLQSLAE